jgi:hypothetical protein
MGLLATFCQALGAVASAAPRFPGRFIDFSRIPLASKTARV